MRFLVKILKVQGLQLLFNGSNHQRTLKVQLDTGATCNILHSKDYMKLGSHDSSKLQTSDTVLRCYGGEVIKPIGEALLQCKFNHKIYDLIFQVVDTPTYQKPLISGETCSLLDIVRVNAKLCKVQEESLYSSWTEEQIKGEFRDVFEGLGCLPGVFHLQIDPTTVPVKHAPRRVPIPLRKKLKDKLKELESMDIIVKKTEPTSWINSMVVVMRKEKMRLCLDPKDLNNALSRPHYQMPTIDDILPNLAKAKIFSVLDAKDGFWQIKLDEESSKLTTFWTPEGRYRWKRLAFGLAPAPEEFQRRLP